jgi:hypothetical protein
LPRDAILILDSTEQARDVLEPFDERWRKIDPGDQNESEVTCQRDTQAADMSDPLSSRDLSDVADREKDR